MGMRTGTWILSIVVALASFGCGQPNADTASSAGENMGARPAVMAEMKAQAPARAVNGDPTLEGATASPALASLPHQTAPPIPQRSIIRNADLAVRVKSIEPAEHQIEKLIGSEGGYVDSAASTDLASDHPEIKLSLRVPVGEFDSTIDAIEAMGVRLSKTVNSQDVTGQLIDLDARLTTMKDEEHVYQGLLKDSHSLDTAMELRDKLTELRSQIESIAGQRKSMGELAALSSISVTLTQSSVAAAPAVDAGWFQETWGQASTFSFGMARVVVGFGLWLLWLAPFWVPAGLLARWYFVKVRKIGATMAQPVSTIH